MMKNRIRQLITIEEAWDRILSSVERGPDTVMDVRSSIGCCTREDVRARIPSPVFDNSAMDGYALLFSDGRKGRKLKIKGRIFAGDPAKARIEEGTCFAVMTGAPVPPNAECVIKREDTDELEDHIVIKTEVPRGANIRPAGSEISLGDIIIEAGEMITPQIAGLILSCGVEKVKVIAPPTVGLVTTGSELVQSPANIGDGKIFDSNRVVLESVMELMRLKSISKAREDDPDSLKNSIGELLDVCDFLVITGGVSVGDRDYTKEILNDLGFEIHFHGI